VIVNALPDGVDLFYVEDEDLSSSVKEFMEKGECVEPKELKSPRTALDQLAETLFKMANDSEGPFDPTKDPEEKKK
jgi:hypothetical protein